jgi:glycosyltransferase involved in cell wall biosynthesis
MDAPDTHLGNSHADNHLVDKILSSGKENLKWAVVIPAYNEALTIKALIAEVLLQKPNRLIVVNDCSSDDTLAILKTLPLTLISNATNIGKALTLWKGFDKAIEMGVDIIITLDGDGQHDPNDIPQLLDKYISEPEMITIGSRQRNPKTQPFARYFANKFANFWVSWAAGYRISDSQSGYRVYPVSLLKNLDKLKQSLSKEGQGFVFESEVLIEAAWQNVYSSSVEIKAIYPQQRRDSHFKPLEDISHITKMVAGRLLEKNMNLPGLYQIIFDKK